MDNIRDITLLKAWKAGDTLAGEKLFQETYDGILRFVGISIFGNVNNRQNIIEDITNEAILRAYHKIDDYNGSVTFYT